VQHGDAFLASEVAEVEAAVVKSRARDERLRGLAGAPEVRRRHAGALFDQFRVADEALREPRIFEQRRIAER
jgi:hypothetical protein